MTYLELLVTLQKALTAHHRNPEIAYDLIIHHTPSLHNREEVIDARNEVVPNPDAIIHDLEMIIERDMPLSQITHHTQFYGFDFHIDDGVFAPRPETEFLVEQVVNFVEEGGFHPQKIVDLGCGTGVIAISLNRLLGEGITYIGVDHNPRAIRNAQENNAHLGTHVNFVWADLTTFLHEQPDHSCDIIVANPPYIAQDDPNVEGNAANWDPADALFAPHHGLYFYEVICAESARILKPNGLLALEIGFAQGDALRALHAKWLPDFRFKIIQDYAHHDRIVLMEGKENV